MYFSHRPGGPWRLVQDAGRTLLLPGASPSPDFVFRFTPRSIERLAAVRGGIGDFAVELFALTMEDDPESRVDLRIHSSFPTLARRGYLKLLLAAGPRVFAFGVRRGIRTLAALRRFVAERRKRQPEEWER